MGYINVFVSSDAYIYVKNNQMILENNNNKLDYPIEDINAVMIESLNTTISTYTLSQFSENGILVYICNKNHLPCGIVLPYVEHYQTLSQFNLQTGLSKPLQKQLWQSIIKNKIKNQNDVLNACGVYDKLKPLADSVLSGDSTNNEAKASLIYFKELFGKKFVRRDDNIINSYLNYGYSILRGLIARSIVVHGLIPFLGLFHSNAYNQFNLADDLIEIFRPIVDMFVKFKLLNEFELTPKIKAEIFTILNIDVIIDNQKQTVNNAVDILIENYIKSLKENKNLLKEVSLCGLNYHSYE